MKIDFPPWHISMLLRPFLFLALATQALPQTSYLNLFSNAESIQDFVVFGEEFPGYDFPPLHNVSVENGTLRIQTSSVRPYGPGTFPVAAGGARLMRSNADFGSGFTNILSQNHGLVSWAFNIANQDGEFNNGFEIILGSTHLDPSPIAAKGYRLTGGGSVGSRMTLYNFNYGTGGGANEILSIDEGLGLLPKMGSFKITFDPLTSEWKLFGTIGTAFQDPSSVNTLLATGVNSTYVDFALPYFGLGGNTTGIDIFDNVSVSVIPESSSVSVVLGLGVMGLAFRMRRTRAIVR